MLELELELGLGFLRFRFLELWVAGCCGYHPQGSNHDQEEKITTRRNVENFVQLCAIFSYFLVYLSRPVNYSLRYY